MPTFVNYILLLATVFVFSIGCQQKEVGIQPDSKQPADLAKLLKQLESEKADDRITALYDLGQLLGKAPDKKDLATAIPKIVAAIGDRDDVTNSSARTVLTHIGEPAAEYFKSHLESNDDVEYAIGAEAIKSIGPAAKKWFPLLKKNLAAYKNNDSKTKRLIWTLEGLEGLEQEAAPLVDEVFELAKHPNIKIPVLVMKIIANNGKTSKAYGPRISKMIDKGPPSVRSLALVALGAIGEHDEYNVLELLTKKLDAFLLIEKQRAMEGMALMGENAKPALKKIESLIDNNSKSAMCSAAYAYWKITGDETKAIAKLKKLLDSRSFADEAIQTIGRMGDSAKTLVPVLKLHLDSPEAVRRENAVFALGDIGAAAEPAIDRLKKMAADDKDAGIRGLARIRFQMIKSANAGARDRPSDQKSFSGENNSPPNS